MGMDDHRFRTLTLYDWIVLGKLVQAQGKVHLYQLIKQVRDVVFPSSPRTAGITGIVEDAMERLIALNLAVLTGVATDHYTFQATKEGIEAYERHQGPVGLL